MVYQLIFKKRFENKLKKLLIYLESVFGFVVAQRFAHQLDKKFQSLQIQPFVGTPSVNLPNVRSILAGKHNRVYYRIESNKIVVINIYDTRINPKKNKLK